MKVLLPLLFLSLSTVTVKAADLDLQLELPSLDVAEYHSPYVAIWLQSSTREVKNLALWYDVKMRNDKGLEWLKDLRQWWRRSGRNMSLPADGFTGATRSAGTYNVSFADSRFGFSSLPAGDYELYIEAVREVGGREIVSLPVSLPITETTTVNTEGNTELGAILLTLTP